MAADLVDASRRHQDRGWIARIYPPSPLIDAMQRWVDSHPGARTVDAIYRGLRSVMDRFPPQEVRAISSHMQGRAFDIQPSSVPEGRVISLHPGAVLWYEGGLRRWHVQF